MYSGYLSYLTHHSLRVCQDSLLKESDGEIGMAINDKRHRNNFLYVFYMTMILGIIMFFYNVNKLGTRWPALRLDIGGI
tara:strand:- start:3352 stop:3588 length:237 start_codon:yes stop_codon:yes gene_type:complete